MITTGWSLIAQRSLAHTQGSGSNVIQEKKQETEKTSGEGQTCTCDFCKASALGVDYHWGGMAAKEEVSVGVPEGLRIMQRSP